MRTRLLPVLCGLLAVAACEAPKNRVPAPPTLVRISTDPGDAPAGKALPAKLVVEARDTDGAPVAGVTVNASVVRGGGWVDTAMTTTGEDGRASFGWTLGAAPVRNRLQVSAGESTVAFEARATLAAPLVPEPFGDVDAFLAAEGVKGSTEDLAFDGKDRLLLGVPGGLVALDAAGKTSRVATTGDAIGWALGLAFDAAGTLWIADSTGAALRRMAADGTVTTVAGGAGQVALKMPNFVTLGPKGHVFLTDSCLGRVFSLDPATGKQVAALDFDVATEGGPNGLAFDRAGTTLYVTTESTGILCMDGTDLTANTAGLYRVPVDAEGRFGARETLSAGRALFGDGMTFDAEGNLYVLFDTANGLALGESALWVMPEGTTELVRFLATTDRVMANAEFGTGAFGETTLYLSLLAFEGITPPSARGVERIQVGIRGMPRGF